MLGIDTNIIVRYLVGDGGNEFARAVDIVENNRVMISLTVVLEPEWVLRDVYEFPRDGVLLSLEKLFGLANVTASEPLAVRKAMTLARAGLAFADALHVAQVTEQETFVTFDKALFNRASRHGSVSLRLA